MAAKINPVITGATGMVGEGVLHECLNHPDVESVLVINRRTINNSHPKIKEVVHKDFFNLSGIEDHLKGYNACFFCLGTTSVGKNENEYTRITFELTKTFAGILHKINPDMVFCYVSGAGTNENGKLMWARVKGKTENYILNREFKDSYMFRPSLITPTKGLKNILTLYKIFYPLLPLIRVLFPGHVCTLKQVSQAMINCVRYGYEKKILEVKDIKIMAENKNYV